MRAKLGMLATPAKLWMLAGRGMLAGVLLVGACTNGGTVSPAISTDIETGYQAAEIALELLEPEAPALVTAIQTLLTSLNSAWLAYQAAPTAENLATLTPLIQQSLALVAQNKAAGSSAAAKAEMPRGRQR